MSRREVRRPAFKDWAKMASVIQVTVYEPRERMPASWQIVLAWPVGNDVAVMAQWLQDSLTWWDVQTAQAMRVQKWAFRPGDEQ